MKLFIKCLPLLAVFSWQAFANEQQVFSGTAQPKDSLELQFKLKQINGLHAQFAQTVTDINGRQIQNGQGQLALASPNKLYWHLTIPDESLIVADGQDVWLYNPFAEEVMVMDMAQVVEASPIALLVQADPLIWQQYLVSKRQVNESQPNTAQECYQIQPKQAGAQVEQVNLCFSNNTLYNFTMTDLQGNLSRFELTQQRGLSVQDQQLFTFSTPAGVDVDDQRTGQ